ncbi:MAG: helix-turn-helix transcriptional regulator [Clostridiales bacterium]|nr:helix-turn-helix transcriptional regulator [Clostridiales bacterium]
MNNLNLDNLITEKIKNEINSSQKSKTQIAKEIGISKPTLSQYLSGRSQPTLANFARLCVALDIDPSDILCTNDKDLFKS